MSILETCFQEKILGGSSHVEMCNKKLLVLNISLLYNFASTLYAMQQKDFSEESFCSVGPLVN